MNSKYLKENFNTHESQNSKNLTINMPLKDIDMNINVSLPMQPQSADYNLLDEVVSPFLLTQDLESSNYNSNPP